MKNANDMLKAIIKVVDTDGDDKIQYEGQHCLWQTSQVGLCASPR